MPNKEPELGQVLGQVLGFVNSDPHCRVRYAAINALGQMCTDCKPHVQRPKYAALVLPTLMTALEDGAPRVRSHAAAALVNFAENCESNETLAPYLEQLLTSLFARLRAPNEPRMVLEQAIICR